VSATATATSRAPSGAKHPGRFTAVLAALPEELVALRERACLTHTVQLGAVRVHCGSLGRFPLLIAATGDGAVRAERGARAVLGHFAVGRLITLGVAGGLTPGLRAGSLIVPSEVRDGGGAAPAPDSTWIRHALTCRQVASGRIFSADRVLGDPASKAAVRATLPGEIPSAVDLESASYARVAAEHGVPYLIARVVLDPADEALPLDFSRFADAEGGVRRVRVLWHAALRPHLVRSLWETRRRVRHASARLAGFVEELLA
jgi:adenosylhomocysteine nucleosidase